jgi:hypothetical protein
MNMTFDELIAYLVRTNDESTKVSSRGSILQITSYLLL